MPQVISRAAVVAVLAVAAGFWLLLAPRTAGMDTGPGPMGLALPEFLALWSAMMAAMMLPATAPVAGLYAASIAAAGSRPVRALRIAAMIGGYLAVWSAIGTVAYGATLGGRWLADTHAGAAGWTAACIFAATAAYQVSPLRARCLKHCRAPFALLFRMTSASGRFRDVRAGALHGAVCLACCLPLMACLIALGTMSMWWMLALTGIVAAERHPRHGRWVTYGAAAGLVLLAVMAPLHPALVPGLHQPPRPMAM